MNTYDVTKVPQGFGPSGQSLIDEPGRITYQIIARCPKDAVRFSLPSSYGMLNYLTKTGKGEYRSGGTSGANHRWIVKTTA